MKFKISSVSLFLFPSITITTSHIYARAYKATPNIKTLTRNWSSYICVLPSILLNLTFPIYFSCQYLTHFSWHTFPLLCLAHRYLPPYTLLLLYFIPPQPQNKSTHLLQYKPDTSAAFHDVTYSVFAFFTFYTSCRSCKVENKWQKSISLFR
jgi:hypothetical protein